jgi:hypothetical protein
MVTMMMMLLLLLLLLMMMMMMMVVVAVIILVSILPLSSTIAILTITIVLGLERVDRLLNLRASPGGYAPCSDDDDD